MDPGLRDHLIGQASHSFHLTSVCVGQTRDQANSASNPHCRFFEWHDESRDPALHLRFSSPESGLTWHDLHQRLHVVILAEAGSGKSGELVRQAQELSAKEKFAFYVTFKELAQCLRELATKIRQQTPSGPQPELVVIDVSSCATPRRAATPQEE
jgi:hypothetical protein